jgi:Protein of unknown function (DUF3429)
MRFQLDAKPGEAIPLAPRVLGIIGVIPFAIGALAMGFLPEVRPDAAAALHAYGAVILWFLGGIRWGFAVLENGEAGWSPFSMSVLPTLVALLGYAFRGPVGLLTLAIALGLWYFAERAAPPSIALPGWYLRQRGMLTAIAVLSLIVAAVAW